MADTADVALTAVVVQLLHIVASIAKALMFLFPLVSTPLALHFPPKLGMLFSFIEMLFKIYFRSVKHLDGF